MNDHTEFGALKYNPQEVAQRGYGMASSGATDDRLIVGFYRKPVLNQFKSKEQGKPVHEDHEYVKIQHPGETLNIVERPVRDDDKMRWPRQWAQFQQGITQIPDGVPIVLLFPDKPSIAATLRGYNIHTVEQLANLSSQGISTVGIGCQDWVNGAKRFMERADKGVAHHKYEAEMQSMKSELVKAQRQVQELTALVHQRNTPAPDTKVYDFQTAQINASHQSEDAPFTAEPARFVSDLSNEVEPKRRGRPPGARNKEQH